MSLLAVGVAAGLWLLFDGLSGGARSLERRDDGGHIRVLLSRGGVRWSVPVFVLVVVAAAIVGAATTITVVRSGTAALLGAAVGAVSPWWWLAEKTRRRQRDMREAWPNALATMVAGLQAGSSLAETCLDAERRAPQALRPGFEAFAITYRSTGSFRSALGALQEVLGEPVTDRVVSMLALAHEVGASDLVRTLRTLAEMVRADVRTRREIEARWSWTISSARVAAAAPWVVLLLMLVRPEATRAYATPAGGIVLVMGAAATLVGYRLMLRAARLPDQERLS